LFLEDPLTTKLTERARERATDQREQFSGMNTQERAERVRILRETLKPSSFDEWVCLGGEYRDMAEVEEWATEVVKEKLLIDYRAFETMNRAI